MFSDRAIWRSDSGFGFQRTSQPEKCSRRKAIDVCRPGDIVVIDSHGSAHTAFWGENMTMSALNRGEGTLGMLLKDEEAADRLGRGDTLLLYTDGAVEIPAADGGELGEEGLARLVWEQVLGRGGGGVHLGQLEEALVRYCGQVHLPDDLALLMLQRCR